MSKNPTPPTSLDETSKFAIDGLKINTIREMQDELDRAVAATAGNFRAKILSLETQLADSKKAVAEVEQMGRIQREELNSSWRERERELETRLNEVEKNWREREQESIQRQKAYENHISLRRRSLDQKSAELEQEKINLENERVRLAESNQESLRANSASFVDATVKELSKKESSLSLISFCWSAIGGAVLVACVLLLSFVSYEAVKSITPSMSWSLLSFYALKGSILIAIVGVTSRYSFILSSNYMKEALRTSDRIHAIKFGQLYVETYGAAADWDQVKEAFSDWNGATDSQWNVHEESKIQDTHPHMKLISDLKSLADKYR